MSYPKLYTNIYLGPIKNRALSLIFFNRANQNALIFDGFTFCYKLKADFDTNHYSELNYSKNANNIEFLIDSIHQDFDIFYIKFGNGDIFQLFFMMDSIQSPQQLLIFEVGKSFYDQAVSRLSNSEECEVEQYESGSISDWLNRKGR